MGVPGVGKSSLVSEVKKKLDMLGLNSSIAVFGTMMFHESMKFGIKDRDELRKLPIQKQKELQQMTAKIISLMKNDIVIIDTHLFINTEIGYYPGLPAYLLEIIKPTLILLILANPDEIYQRRKNDSTRNRDQISVESINTDLEISKMMVSASALLTGTTFQLIMNHDGKIDEACNKMVNIIKQKFTVIKNEY